MRFQQRRLQLSSVSVDLLFNPVKAICPAAELALQMMPEGVNLLLNRDAGLRRNASIRFKIEFLLEFMTPSKQPFRARFVQTRNPSQTLFSNVGGGLNTIRE